MIFNKIAHFFRPPSPEDKVMDTIEEIIDERANRGDDILMQPEELNLFKNLFALQDLRAGEISTPSIDIVAIDSNIDAEELKRIILKDKFTRLPVYENTIDNIVGVVHAKDVLCALLDNKKLSIKQMMTGKVLFVPASMRALDLLKELQSKKMQIAIIIDEYGATDGLITLEDLLEEIVGEIEDEHDALDTPPILHKTGKNTLIADARISLSDIQEITGPFLSSNDKLEEIDTIGGFVFQLAGMLPSIGDKITHESGLVFHIIDVDARHIKQIKITHFNGPARKIKKEVK